MSFSFFFFKQKTAYEVRISDWSSDVCSSDLKPQNIIIRNTNHSTQPNAYSCCIKSPLSIIQAHNAGDDHNHCDAASQWVDFRGEKRFPTEASKPDTYTQRKLTTLELSRRVMGLISVCTTHRARQAKVAF